MMKTTKNQKREVKNETQAKTIMSIDIPTSTIIKIVAIIAIVAGIYILRDIIVAIFFSFVLASTLKQPIKRLEKLGIKKSFAVTIVYILMIIILLLLISAISVPLISQMSKMFDNLPTLLKNLAEYINNIAEFFGYNQKIIDTSNLKETINKWLSSSFINFDNILSASANGISGLLGVIANMFGGIVVILTVFSLGYYISLDDDRFERFILQKIKDEKFRKKTSNFINAIQNKFGKWIMGQITVSIINASYTWLLLTLLGVPYALPLALFAGLVDWIPYIGATLGALPALFVASMTGGPIQIIGVLAGYIVYQQIENNIVAPKIMSNAIGLPPLVIIISLMVGAKLFGFTGILLAVPVAGVLHLLMNYAAKED
ncbi:AI-2E family transporter [Candidatus Dojkabacteria bacterium]|nr:AI-2E family transporter [Candidatus Dojkabacteria bacterium]